VRDRIVIACFNHRYWSGNNPDRFYLVVDVGKDVYFYDSMEG
jgi:hypothetical protein